MHSFFRLMSVWVAIIFAALPQTARLFAAEEPSVDTTVVIYGEEGKFGGWPANHGMWMWGDEILVGLSTGDHKDLGENYHNIDRDKPEHHVLARSLDGGLSWSLEFPAEQNVLIMTPGMRHGTMPPGASEPDPVPCPGGIDFAHPDFCMTLRMADINTGVSRMYYSYDRGKSWKGPFSFPLFGQQGIMARTDYIVNGPHDCFAFVTAAKENNREGRPLCVRTTDGGKTWKLVSFIGPEPQGFGIMPSTVRTSENTFVTAIRRREDSETENGSRHRWLDAWRSHDLGKTWEKLSPPVEDLGEGNPPSMIKLADGRLCLTYGLRKAPWQMEAKFSSDEGTTWTEPFVIRGGGGGRDIGYPRTLQRPDGKIVTTYYFWTPDNIYRRVEATIWDPGTVEKR